MVANKYPTKKDPLFTDEDLKILKDNRKYWAARTQSEPTNLDGLLMRLYAAEKVIAESFDHRGEAFIGLDDWHEALLEWQKVSGKAS
jgi:hypothetical protein